MTVSSFTTDDLFVVRVKKHHYNNPSDTWVNNYEFQALTDGTEGDLLDLGQIVLAFEQQLHMVRIQFDAFSISTWEADSKPYNPAAFISVAVTDAGQTGEVSGMIPINQTFSVARVAAFGRLGHLFYRGCLDTAEVFAPAGINALVDPTEAQARVHSAVSESGLDAYMGAGATQFGLVMVNKTGTQVRGVTGLQAAGVTTLPTDHAWFNRTTTP
jgi:hypothetical protein